MFKPRTYYKLFLTLLIITMAIPSLASAQDDLVWNLLDPENTVYLQMQEGTVVIELNPTFAPKTVAHIKSLLEEQFYRGTSFYRVIEGFVAQGGDESDIDGSEVARTVKGNWRCFTRCYATG